MDLTEGFAPRGFEKLARADRDAYVDLIRRHVALGMLAMRLSRYHQMLQHDIPVLPLVDAPAGDFAPLPEAITAATGYRDLLALLLEHGAASIAEFRQVQQQHGLGRFAAGSDDH